VDPLIAVRRTSKGVDPVSASWAVVVDMVCGGCFLTIESKTSQRGHRARLRANSGIDSQSSRELGAKRPPRTYPRAWISTTSPLRPVFFNLLQQSPTIRNIMSLRTTIQRIPATARPLASKRFASGGAQSWNPPTGYLWNEKVRPCLCRLPSLGQFMINADNAAIAEGTKAKVSDF
jgi:hypothetical protein